MRSATIIPAIAFLFALSGGASCQKPGSGVEGREGRAIEPFVEVDASGIVGVEIDIGPQTSFEVVGDDNLLAAVTATVDNGRLTLATKGSLVTRMPLVVHLETPDLRRITLSGASEAAVRGVTGERFEVEISGATELDVDGSVEQFYAEVSGAGDVDADALRAQTVEVALSGAGHVEVYASTQLQAEVSGAGSVRYAGDPPEVNQDISGAGTVRPL